MTKRPETCSCDESLELRKKIKILTDELQKVRFERNNLQKRADVAERHAIKVQKVRNNFKKKLEDKQKLIDIITEEHNAQAVYIEDILKAGQIYKDARTIAEAWDEGYGCVCEPIKEAVILCQVCKAAERILKGAGDE